MNWILTAASILAVLFVVIIVLQVIWLRNKLKNYEPTKLLSEMNQQALITTQTSHSNLSLYSVILDVVSTMNLNNQGTFEYSDAISIGAPKTFSIPHVCGTSIASARLSCNDIAFLCLKNNFGAQKLLLDVQSGSLMYVMIDSVYYLILYDTNIVKLLKNSYPAYNDLIVFSVFTISSSKNIVLDTVVPCKLELVPFFGQVSMVNAIISMNIDATLQQQQFHILGYVLSKNS